MAVTPVRTGPLPTSSLPSPEISVVWPTSTPLTSVMALLGPGVPSKGTPRSRARGLVWADSKVQSVTATAANATRRGRWNMRPPGKQAVYKRGSAARGSGDWTRCTITSRNASLGGKMESWKKAVVLSSIGAASILFMKKRYPAGVLATGRGSGRAGVGVSGKI